MPRIALLLVASLLALVTRADALVMCGPKTKSGTLREGAPIRLRSACKPNEIVIDPVGLGLQGPPGPPSGGAVARDSDGALIGYVFDVETGNDSWARVVIGATGGSDSRPLIAPIRRSGFVVLENVFYLSSDCTGEPLLYRNPFSGDFATVGVPLGGENLSTDENGYQLLSGSGTLIYFSVGPFSSLTPASIAGASTAEDCQNAGGTFSAPSVCCYGYNSSGLFAPAATVDVGAFGPPFRIDVP